MAESAGPLLPTLKSIVGEANVLTAADEVAPFCIDWRERYRGSTRAVVRPGSTAEVASVVRCCAEHGVPVVPQGGNTGLCGGATPHESGDEVVISLSRLNRVRAIDAANATMTVEAGVPLAAVQDAAAKAGLLFPLSLAAEGSCLIGGNLATNAGGTAVLRYGNARDLVVGLEVVLADGRVWESLKGLRKDNTGYDLKQLFLGSEGTLGIITAAVLKLFPQPRTSATAWAGIADVAASVALLRAMRAALGDRLTGFELVSAECVALACAQFPTLSDPLPGHPWYALIQADDAAAGSPLLGEIERALAEAVAEGLAQDATIAQSQAQANALWAIREHIPDAQRRQGPNMKHDISVPVSRIPVFLDRARAALDAAFPGVRYFVFGHLGDGNLHYNLSSPAGIAPAEFIAETPRANRIVYDLVAEQGGSFSAEHGIGQMKRADLARYKPAIEVELMRRIKHALDPDSLLNPGKVLP
ncbi:MAG TPA: FAD-binding oxidoreductase [Casimicrobiaceae bacterium]|nr:FAD-binding oxidoreductase [Casimicrobiaceae bacterium]